MNIIFSPITQPYIRSTLEKKRTRVSALLIPYETRKNPKRYFKVLSCVIYTIINHYVCIDYLACEQIKLSGLPVVSGGVFKHRNKSYGKILGIGVPNLLMKLMSCHGFLRNFFCCHI